MKSTALCAALLTGICLKSWANGLEKEAPAMAPRFAAVVPHNQHNPAALGGIHVLAESHPAIEAMPALPAASAAARPALEEGPGEVPGSYKNEIEGARLPGSDAPKAGPEGQASPEQSKKESDVLFDVGASVGSFNQVLEGFGYQMEAKPQADGKVSLSLSAKETAGQEGAAKTEPITISLDPAKDVHTLKLMSGHIDSMRKQMAAANEAAAANKEPNVFVDTAKALFEVFRDFVKSLVAPESASAPAAPEPAKSAADKVYPKVVMVLDTFHEAASDAVIQYTEKLLDLGVHVVFVTPRAEKGENSAESVFISKLKPRQGNPVMIVSSNGARITTHKPTRAENPKPVVPDQEGLSDALGVFRAVNAQIASKYGIAGELSDAASPSEENAYLYSVRIPASHAESLVAIARDYNAALSRAHLSYRVSPVKQADGSVLLQTQSTALRLNTGRIFNAILGEYTDLRGRLKQEDVFILADSTRATRFLNRSLPGKDVIPGNGYGIQGATNQAELEAGLFALLHGKGLEDVKVTRQQLRAYIDWQAARERYGHPRSGGGFRMGELKKRYERGAGFFRGIILYHLMGEIYHRVRSHDWDHASLPAALDLLDEMSAKPEKFGINLNEELEGMRASKLWKSFAARSKGILRDWLTRYYRDNFPDYPKGLSEEVVQRLINLARDGGNNIKISYESPMTRRRYNVGVLPARAQVEPDEKGGFILVGHAYRSGKEIRQDDFEESLEVNLLQQALLEGYAKKDKKIGQWTVNSRPVRVMVVFHTKTRDLPSDIMTPEQVEARSGEVMSLIEKMLSDKEFLDYWETQKAQNAKVVRKDKKDKKHS